MQLLSLTEVRRHAQNGAAVEARVHVQIEGVAAKVTREQKPYCELSLADACDRMTLRVWSDHPEYKPCSTLKASDFIELCGEFVQHHQFGLDARNYRGETGNAGLGSSIPSSLKRRRTRLMKSDTTAQRSPWLRAWSTTNSFTP